jgi:hypothetical protein
MVFGTRIRAGFARKEGYKMKVSTNIHSGNIINEASQAADQLYGEVANFVSTANQSADDIRNKATELVNSAWTTVSGSFSTS